MMEQQTQLRDGATVFGADGDKVGTMRTHGDQYIVVEKGFFFPTDYYIPVSAISTASDSEVYLSVSKDDALNQGWDLEPSHDFAPAPTNGVERQNVAAGDSTLRVPVHEEVLGATKRTEKMGDVSVSKHTVTEQAQIDVPVKEERVRVEWKESAGETGGTHEGASLKAPS